MLRAVTLLLFFVSGFAALLYQVTWQRVLTLFSGADVYSATIVVAAFMGGLGVGSLAGGHLADRVSQRASLLLFAGAEAAIAAFGLMSTALYYDTLYQQFGTLQIPPAAMAVVLFVALLPPTFLMGLSLPLLARALAGQISRTAATVGALYALNTLGAAAGALTATWWLLPNWGLEGAVEIAAWLNFVCALAVVPLALTPSLVPAPGAQRKDRSSHTPAAPGVADDVPIWFWYAAYGVAGFVALSLEILWFRILGVLMKSTAFTFGTLLGTYLTGLGLGALAGAVIAPRVRRPSRTFFLLQAGGGLSAALLIGVVVILADTVPAFRSYFESYEPLNVRDSVHALRQILASVMLDTSAAAGPPSNFLRMYIGVPVLLIVLPTFLLGCSFPVLQRVVHDDIARVGRRVGALLVANIVGSILGATITGWILLSVLGTAGTLKLLVALSGVFAIPVVDRWWTAHRTGVDRPLLRPSSVAVLAAGAVVATLVVTMPDTPRLWSRLHGTSINRMILAEDGSGVSLIKTEQRGFEGRRVVYVNGLGQSTLPYGDIHTALGAVPAFVHPQPVDALIIGLGSGDTVFAVSGRPSLRRITSVEIIGPQLDTLRALARFDAYPGLQSLLADPRIAHVTGDGRTYLLRGAERYDIIEADALRPTSAYAGNLYSEEYFQLVSARLKPGGIAATWAASERVHNAFVRVFPYVVNTPGVLIGSHSPMDVDAATVALRLEAPGIGDYYRAAGIDIRGLINAHLHAPVLLTPETPRDVGASVNTDLFPRDEYDLTPPR